MTKTTQFLFNKSFWTHCKEVKLHGILLIFKMNIVRRKKSINTVNTNSSIHVFVNLKELSHVIDFKNIDKIYIT
jgi:hypothetical protein